MDNLNKYCKENSNVITVIIPEYNFQDVQEIPQIRLEDFVQDECSILKIIAHKNSKAIIINNLNINQCFGIIEENSDITIIKSQESQIEMINSEEIWEINRNSSLSILDIETSNMLSVKSYSYNLVGENSNVDHKTLSILDEDNKSILTTKQNHKSSSSKSSVIVKTVLFGKSESKYNSLIKIDKNGKNTEASQKQVVLMLSDQARNMAIPSLEVNCFDVQCKHGSATGYIDQEHLWYLYSKGFSKTQAFQVILLGFFKDIEKDFKCSNLNDIISKFYNCIKNKYL